MTVEFPRWLRVLGSGKEGDLGEEDAYRLFGAMLDGGVPELELGAIAIALRSKGETLGELLGFYRALAERVSLLALPEGLRAVVLPSYGGTRRYPNLTPLLALLLSRFGIPVLVHGTLEGNGGTTCAQVFRALGVLPCATQAQAQQAFLSQGLAFVPAAALAPGLAGLLSLRARLGADNSAHLLARFLDPFGGEGFRLVGLEPEQDSERVREFLVATGARALLLEATEGEPFANPQQRPKLEYFAQGSCCCLFEAEASPVKTSPPLPPPTDVSATAAWIRQALKGDAPVPLPLVNQLACCLYGAGYAEDINQAKAIAAVETRSLAGA